jgi:hypothetical protein
LEYGPKLGGGLPDFFFFPNMLGDVQRGGTKSHDGAKPVAEEGFMNLHRDDFSILAEIGLLFRHKQQRPRQLAPGFIPDPFFFVVRSEVRIMFA